LSFEDLGHGAALEALAVDVHDALNNGDPVVILIVGIDSFDLFGAGVRMSRGIVNISGLFISI
jgi:hypothetical protein